MERTKISFALTLSLVLLLLSSPAWAQIEVGDFTIRGEGEFGGVLRDTNGKRQKFEEYRDLSETVIVPQLQLMIGGKKEDFYLNFDSSNLGRHNQNYLLRFGRYGLLDVEFEWDQFPHIFSLNTARTPYTMRDGNYTLGRRVNPTPNGAAGTFDGADVRDWVNSEANAADLKMFNGFGKFKVRYTPSTNWTFTGNYSSQNVAGRRAFGGYFGPSPGNYNIAEVAEPLDYQIHNIDLGGEYAGNGWSLGLRYNASLFHNNVSSLVWDNPVHATSGGDGTGTCTDSATYNNGTGTGPCRGRMDLYPSNQAHTWTLSGASALPFKTHFMGTASYGMRIQNDAFLPFTINSAVAQPRISRDSLDGDVRPLMVNATVVNRYIDRLDLKAYYRLYDFDNRSKKVFFPDGIIINDQGTAADAGLRSFPNAYSKQNVGFDASYQLTRWLSAKMGYLYENMHRERREVLQSNEHSFGPTFDITPLSWLSFRLGYKRFIRDAHDYDAGRLVVVETEDAVDDVRASRTEALRKFDEAARDRDKLSFFTQLTPWEPLTVFGGFDFFYDDYPRTVLGVQKDVSYVPSLGFTYAPRDWVTLFSNYSWERADWRMQAMERTANSQNPTSDPLRTWRSRGLDQTNTVSLGSDMKLIQNLTVRLQYTFSEAESMVRASGSTCAGCTAATNYPNVTSRWHEFLTRLDYRLHKNVTLRFGYYFNRFNSKDAGVDIMKPWMGDVDTGTNVQRSIFLGDQIKRPYTAHVGLLGLRFSF